MITILEKDADEISNYLRKLLNEDIDEKKKFIKLKKDYEDKSNELINTFISNLVPLEHQESFNDFSVFQINEKLKNIELDINNINKYLCLLAIGSEV